MRRRDGGIEMMLGMKEHRVGEPVQPSSALRPPGFVSVAPVVHGPHGKEAGETFADQHRAKVPSQCNPAWKRESNDYKHGDTEHFMSYPGALAAACQAPGGSVQANEK